jgi:hypothetical protein
VIPFEGTRISIYAQLKDFNSIPTASVQLSNTEPITVSPSSPFGVANASFEWFSAGSLDDAPHTLTVNLTNNAGLTIDYLLIYSEASSWSTSSSSNSATKSSISAGPATQGSRQSSTASAGITASSVIAGIFAAITLTFVVNWFMRKRAALKRATNTDREFFVWNS